MENTEVSNEATAEVAVDQNENSGETTQEVSAEGDPESNEGSSENTENSGEEQPTARTEETTEEPGERQILLNINGEKINKPLSEVIRMAQKNISGDKKLEEAAEARKAVAMMYEKLKNNTWEAIREMGKDPEQMATDLLYEKIQKEKMSPEEREAMELRKKVKEYEEKENSLKKIQEEERQNAIIEQNIQQIDMEIAEAIEKSTISRTNLNIKNIARYMAEGLERGIPISAKEAVKLIEEDEREAISQKFAGDGETLFNTIGEEAFKKMNKYYLNKIGANNSGNTSKFEANTTEKSKKAPNKKTWDQLLKEIKGIT